MTCISIILSGLPFVKIQIHTPEQFLVWNCVCHTVFAMCSVVNVTTYMKLGLYIHSLRPDSKYHQFFWYWVSRLACGTGLFSASASVRTNRVSCHFLVINNNVCEPGVLPIVHNRVEFYLKNMNLEVLKQFVTNPILSDLMFEEHRRCQRACGRKYISSEACIFYERNSLST